MISNVFEVPIFKMDKFVHMFVQNLCLRIEPAPYKKYSKISFITYIDTACRIRQQLLYTMEKIRDIHMQQNLDLSNEKHVQYFIEKYINFPDKFIPLDNTQLLTSHLKNINTKILQRVKARRKTVESLKKVEIKVLSKNVCCKKKVRINLENKLNGGRKNAHFPASCRERHSNLHNYKRSKCRRSSIPENSKIYCHDVTTLNNRKDGDVSKIKHCNQEVPGKNSLQSDMINIMKKEVKMAEKFLWLYIEDVECIKKKVEITLYLAKKESHNDTRDRIEYNKILCRHAILCLIEPSEKAFVLLEDNLSLVIQKYLSQGYKYHFEFQRDSQSYYTALLILSQWAKHLLKHIDTTMMHTIRGILGCDAQNILVLYRPEEK